MTESLMSDKEIISIALAELEEQTFAITRQYLEIHEVCPVEGSYEPLHIKRLDHKTAQVYFSIVDEKFWFTFYINLEQKRIQSVDMVPFCEVYACIYSDNSSVAELTTMTCLVPSETREKGEINKFGNHRYQESTLIFKPNTKPDDFENMLEALLSFLESDLQGMQTFTTNELGVIRVHMIFHKGNGILGGMSLSKDHMRRIAQLGFEVDFDLYTSGEEFKEE